ncbi:glycerophosphodiester phosphodiesterase family protein [Cystoisospora suis]|uniref:Glycerophosphodiester phosphodiesterase family protein n=1 Tax=Cystoisospora suis TaxID=483139 RepID=A0A2C6KJ24_9APIC|nr:glycerophosphodiester phosphodiesterase family protein [Cystoisospora suis]
MRDPLDSDVSSSPSHSLLSREPAEAQRGENPLHIHSSLSSSSHINNCHALRCTVYSFAQSFVSSPTSSTLRRYTTYSLNRCCPRRQRHTAVVASSPSLDAEAPSALCGERREGQSTWDLGSRHPEEGITPSFPVRCVSRLQAYTILLFSILACCVSYAVLTLLCIWRNDWQSIDATFYAITGKHWAWSRLFFSFFFLLWVYTQVFTFNCALVCLPPPALRHLKTFSFPVPSPLHLFLLPASLVASSTFLVVTFLVWGPEYRGVRLWLEFYGPWLHAATLPAVTVLVAASLVFSFSPPTPSKRSYSPGELIRGASIDIPYASYPVLNDPDSEDVASSSSSGPRISGFHAIPTSSHSPVYPPDAEVLPPPSEHNSIDTQSLNDRQEIPARGGNPLGSTTASETTAASTWSGRDTTSEVNSWSGREVDVYHRSDSVSSRRRFQSKGHQRIVPSSEAQKRENTEEDMVAATSSKGKKNPTSHPDTTAISPDHGKRRPLLSSPTSRRDPSEEETDMHMRRRGRNWRRRVEKISQYVGLSCLILFWLFLLSGPFLFPGAFFTSPCLLRGPPVVPRPDSRQSRMFAIHHARKRELSKFQGVTGSGKASRHGASSPWPRLTGWLKSPFKNGAGTFREIDVSHVDTTQRESRSNMSMGWSERPWWSSWNFLRDLGRMKVEANKERMGTDGILGDENLDRIKGELSWLPPKPLLVGHRGLPELRPENTEISYDAAVAMGCDGLESDVMVSADGIPFLLHDPTFARTTNIAKVFPSRARTRADLFTWMDIEQLNTGEWWLKTDPYGTADLIDPVIRQQILSQKVPKLEWLMRKAVESNRSLIYDLRCPDCDSNTWGCESRCVDLTIDLMRKTNSSGHMWWLQEKRKEVKEEFPDVTIVTPADRHFKGDADNLTDILNVEWVEVDARLAQEWIRQGFWVHPYVVSQPWLLSYYWCAGAGSVTTNSCHRLGPLTAPVYALSWNAYLWCVGILDIACLLILFFILFMCLKRSSAAETCASDTSSTAVARVVPAGTTPCTR